MSFISNVGKKNKIPHHLQSFVINEYARKKKFKIVFNVVKLADDGNLLFFENRLKEKPNISGFIAYSILSLGDIKASLPYLAMTIDFGFSFYFATEDIRIKSHKDIDKLIEIYLISYISNQNANYLSK